MRVPPDVRIVQASPPDAVVIASIVRHAYETIPDDQTPTEMPIYHADFHREAMKDPATRWWMLHDREEPAGVASWRMLRGLAYLELLFVVGHKQGRGYGSLLLKHFEDRVRQEDPTVRLLTLHCLFCSSRSLRFYRRHGFVEYQPQMEGRIPELYLWLDAVRQEGSGLPTKDNKQLFFKLLR